jgi:uncharacterized protein YggU (UPF0235/DUF167 family)
MTHLTVRVHPRASSPRLEWDGATLGVWVHEAAADGAANAAVLRAVAQGLGTGPSALRLITGRAGRIKVIDIGNQTPPAA